MGTRRKARELAVQILFQMEFNSGDPEYFFDLICVNFDTKASTKPFSKRLVLGVCDKKHDLDALITKASKNWRLERMPNLDKSILRIAVFEMLFINDIPPKVSIDEAVEIGKKYGSEDSGSFINGILDKIYNKLLSENLIE